MYQHALSELYHMILLFFCFSPKRAALRSKSNDWLIRNQDNVSEWSDMSTRQTLSITPLDKYKSVT
jgi:hypothetical protein